MNVLRRRLSLNIARVRGPLSHCSRISTNGDDATFFVRHAHHLDKFLKHNLVSQTFWDVKNNGELSRFPKWTAPVVRKEFLRFFERNAHSVVPSSSVVPHNDPTLLFTNAGMNQFKPIFLGTVGKTDDMAQLKRAVDTQKDLDDVGKDSYHLDSENGVPADTEAKELWLKAGVKEDHILTGNMKDNFWEMDVFSPLFAKIQEVTNARPYTDKYGKDDTDGIDTAYRVIADHIRLLTFAISDGGVPNNEGRGYVVRRVLRRGSRYARKYFNAEIGSFFSKILPALVEQMGEQFPEIVKKQQDVKEILDEEEEAFARTLDRGEKMFEKYAAQAISQIPRSSLVQMYGDCTTLLVSRRLTKIMAEERGLETDEGEIEIAKEKARDASKSVKEAAHTFAKLDVHQIAELDKMGVPQTNDDAKFSKGDSTGKIQLSTMARASTRARGQVFDTGKIIIDGVAEFKVLDTQSHGGYIVHNGYMDYGSFKAGDEVICEYDELRRQPIRNNHTGTHILNHALREHLGEDINQKGSLVDQDKLRFDFSHKSPVPLPELKKIEDSSNSYIKQNCKIYSKEVDLDIAKGIEGVRAVFGETYPNPVRVVSVGVEVDILLAEPKNPEWRKVSVEFCGGTHVDQTGIIKDLVIVEESGIAKGIRRIIAYTGDAAHEVQRVALEFEKRIAALDALPHGVEKEQEAKATQNDLNHLTISVLAKADLKKKFDKVQKDVLDEQKRKQKAESKTALDTVIAHFADPKNKDSTAYIGQLPISANSKAIADVMNHFKAKAKDKTVYLFGGSVSEGAVVHGVYVGTDAASKGVSAEQWAAAVSEIVGGRSGGKEPTRTGQGTNPDKIEDAVAVAEKWFAEKLKL
ncbi:hypothetical protein DID88_008712 [Monilinia fructigena]|uniref:alanine--tRNA ligase n=1 Tax=Monilinia fructigena TaxID=38457 RepID=A0A395J761_9HELO|nr:hypothetical protein DID88_008712 [Monilinia fructigena]